MKFAYFTGQTHCRASQQFVASSSPSDSLIADSRFKFRLNKLIGDVYSLFTFSGVWNCVPVVPGSVMNPFIHSVDGGWLNIFGEWQLIEKKFSSWRRHCPSTTLSNTIHAGADFGLNPIRYDGMSAIDSLSYGMAPTV